MIFTAEEARVVCVLMELDFLEDGFNLNIPMSRTATEAV